MKKTMRFTFNTDTKIIEDEAELKTYAHFVRLSDWLARHPTLNGLLYSIALATMHTITIMAGWYFFLDCPLKNVLWILPWQWIMIINTRIVINFFMKTEEKIKKAST